jgi:hypothetical protein
MSSALFQERSRRFIFWFFTDGSGSEYEPFAVTTGWA